MAISNLVCVLAAVLLFVAGGAESSSCQSALKPCKIKMNSLEQLAQAGDMSNMCRVTTEATECLKAAKSQCSGDELDKVNQALDGLKENNLCQKVSGGNGQTSDNDKPKCNFLSCLTTETSKEAVCKALKCVKKNLKECMDKNMVDMFKKTYQKFMDTASDTCGCVNLKPSVLIVLASIIMLLFGSRF